MPDPAGAPRALSTVEGALFKGLKDTLPGGWAVAFEANAGMAWVALVYRAETPTSAPLFTICRWDNCVGLFVRWVDGAVASAGVFTELSTVLDLIPSSIFAVAEARLTTVQAGSWSEATH